MMEDSEYNEIESERRTLRADEVAEVEAERAEVANPLLAYSESVAIRSALRLAWRALVADVSNGVGHMSVIRAANAADRARYDKGATGWYATAINHYLDR